MPEAAQPAPRRVRVFLCHAHADKDTVQGLYQRLKDAGAEPWLDEEDLIPGQLWQVEIPKAVRRCDAVLVCLTDAFREAGYRQKEVKLALETFDEQPPDSIWLIPVRLEECTPYEPLERFHRVDLFAERGFERLLRALRARGKQVGASLLPATRPELASAVRGVTIEFVRIPAGEFQMGCSPGDNECWDREKPAHRVRITKSFEMGKYQVTQAQWEAVMGERSNPSYFKGANRPVESVSWEDAQQFISKLNERGDGYRYRLPTEAEWEYAARAGARGARYGELDEIAWYGDNSGNERIDALALWESNPDWAKYYERLKANGNGTHPVGKKNPNAFGCLRHAGERVGMVPGLVPGRLLWAEPSRRPARTRKRRGSNAARRFLGQRCAGPSGLPSPRVQAVGPVRR